MFSAAYEVAVMDVDQNARLLYTSASTMNDGAYSFGSPEKGRVYAASSASSLQ